MLSALARAGLVAPTIASIAALGVLIGLGNWQMDRKVWKDGLLNELNRLKAAAPVPLAQAIREGQDGVPARFRRVRFTARLLNEEELHVWRPQRSGPAWSVMVPVVPEPGSDKGRNGAATQGSAAASFVPEAVLVDRGSVPQVEKEARAAEARSLAEPVEIVGRVRFGAEAGWFAGGAVVEKNEWYTRDLGEMAAYLMGREGALSQSGRKLATKFYIEAEQPIGGEGAPQPNLSDLRLSNRHLEYAVTWYGLAATLIGVYAFFAYTRLKRVREREGQREGSR